MSEIRNLLKQTQARAKRVIEGRKVAEVKFVRAERRCA
jgi:hypothetical protein